MPLHNVEAEYLKTKLCECLDKAKISDYVVVNIVIDGAATNLKVLKDVLKSTIDTDEENKLPDAALKFEPYFMHNDKKYFVIFFLPHIVKCVRNIFIKKDNYFKYPKLVLSTGHTLEAGICTFKWIKELHEKNKNEIISSVRLKKHSLA